MPELPEVETIRAGLAKNIVNKKIVQVNVNKEKIVRGTKRSFIKRLSGASFSGVNRHGKLLLLPIVGANTTLLIHLKMTGQLIYQAKTRVIAGGHQWPPVKKDELPNAYTHVEFTFKDGSHLYFNDLRQFGFMELASKKRTEQALVAMGVDPITETLTWEYFNEKVKNRKTSIKAVLLNQEIIAGIGNIYADEICHRALVRPQRKANRLTARERRAIFDEIIPMLQRAISFGGTTFRDYMDSEGGKGNFTELLSVYGRAGELCTRCKKGTIQKIVVAQRGTHYCPICQK